jgi:hypothetical protein
VFENNKTAKDFIKNDSLAARLAYKTAFRIAMRHAPRGKVCFT